MVCTSHSLFQIFSISKQNRTKQNETTLWLQRQHLSTARTSQNSPGEEQDGVIQLTGLCRRCSHLLLPCSLSCPLHNPITSLPLSSAASEQPHSAARRLSGTAATLQGTELHNILSGNITSVNFFFSRSNIIKELDVIFHANRREMSVKLGKLKNSHYIWLSNKTWFQEEQFFLVHTAVIPSTYWSQGAFATESVGRGFPLCIQQTINIS